MKILKERFENKFIPVTESGCWLWLGCVQPKGYGDFFVHKGLHQLAHRISWQLYIGEIPDDLCILHKCDIPSCVRPDHLFLGTRIDNNEDMIAKGRYKGGKNFLEFKNKTQCANGHRYDEENTYLWRNHRQCKVCKALYNEKRYKIDKLKNNACVSSR